MAAIASIDASAAGHFAAALTTLSASDTITIAPAKKQLLVLRNPTGGTLTLTIDGADGTTVTVPGIGVVDVSAGYAIPVTTLLSRAVMLNTINAYTKGVVTMTGASGMIAQLFDI